MTQTTTYQHSLQFPSDTAIGFQVQEQILAQLRDHHYPDKILFGIRLSIEEAIINAIKHGNKLDPNKKVHVRYTIDDKCFSIEIEDEGMGFRPEAIPDPTAPENLERPCGRGLLLMRSYMTDCDFLNKGRICRMRRVNE